MTCSKQEIAENVFQMNIQIGKQTALKYHLRLRFRAIFRLHIVQFICGIPLIYPVQQKLSLFQQILFDRVGMTIQYSRTPQRS